MKIAHSFRKSKKDKAHRKKLPRGWKSVAISAVQYSV